MTLDVLMHAEDPGAANILAPLSSGLGDAGLSSRLMASGAAVAYLTDRAITHEPVSDGAGEVLDSVHPRVLVAGTSEDRDGFGLALIDAARERAIPSLGAVDMLANAAFRFRGNSDDPLRHAPDWLAVPDQATADAFAKLGFAHDRVVACGHPHFDVMRARRAEFATQSRADLRAERLPDLPADRPLLVFVAEGIDQLNPAASRIPQDSALTGSGQSLDRTTVVLEELLEAVDNLDPRPVTVLRLHPKNRPDDYGALADRVDHVSHGGDALPLIWCADLVAGMTTFLLVEAHLLGRPTLSVLPDPTDSVWLPTTAAGATPVVSTRESLATALADRLQARTAKVQDNALLPSGATQRYVQLVGHLVDLEKHSNRAQ